MRIISCPPTGKPPRQLSIKLYHKIDLGHVHFGLGHVRFDLDMSQISLGHVHFSLDMSQINLDMSPIAPKGDKHMLYKQSYNTPFSQELFQNPTSEYLSLIHI